MRVLSLPRGFSNSIDRTSTESKLIDRSPQSIVARVTKFAVTLLGGIVWMGLCAVATVTVIPAALALRLRYKSHKQNKAVIQNLAFGRFKIVREKVTQLIYGKKTAPKTPESKKEFMRKKQKEYDALIGIPKAKLEYRDRVLDLIALLHKSSEKGLHDKMQGFRRELDALIAHPVYEKNRDKRSNFYIQFIHEASHALIAQSSGMDEMRVFGTQFVKKGANPTTYKGFADVIKESVTKATIFTGDSKVKKIWWSFTHPLKARAAFFDVSGIEAPVGYNSYEHGNASVHLGTFQVNGRSFSLTQSATFSADRLTEAARDRGDVRLVQDLEVDHGPHGESGRVALKRQVSEEISQSGSITHLHTPIDVHKGEFAKAYDFTNIEGFADRYLEGKEAAKAVLYAAVKGMVEMKKEGEKVSEGSTIYLNQSCKQNIDRGVVVNTATILMADVLADKSIDETRVNEIVGMIIARPGMVDGRAILKGRLDPLLDLMRVMDEPAFKVALRSDLAGVKIKALQGSKPSLNSVPGGVKALNRR